MYLSPSFIAKAKEKGIEPKIDSMLITFKFTSMENETFVVVDNNSTIAESLPDLIKDYSYLRDMNDSNYEPERKPEMDEYLSNFKTLLKLLVDEL